jgi:hypothetical protein
MSPGLLSFLWHSGHRQSLPLSRCPTILRQAGPAHGPIVDQDDSGHYTNIEPGASGGIVVMEIAYVDEPLTYEVTAIGIPAEK